MADLIKRQDAIDAINCNIVITGKRNAEEVASTIGTFVDRIKALPSAETEIIRCNDCKHWFDIDDGRQRHERCADVGGDWYCADAERRENE